MGCVVWASDANGEPIFGIDLIITDIYVRRYGDSEAVTPAQAIDLGLRYAHGLIDTETWVSSEDAVEVIRDSEKDPGRNDSTLTDDDLTHQLLKAFARMDRISGSVDYAPRLDVDGYADVVGVTVDRIRGLLGTLATRGWIEGYGHEKQPHLGHARITANGYDKLEAMKPVSSTTIGATPFVAEVMAFLSADDFRRRFPKASASWDHASGLLSETPLKAGIIGYACREA